MNTIRSSTTLILFTLFLLVGFVNAGSHNDAIDTANKISQAINSVTLPYEREFTPAQLNTLGVTNRNRPFGTYKIRIKEASYNSSSGLLILSLYAWHNNTPLATHSPWVWYIPSPIPGTNDNQRLTSFLILLGTNIDNLPYGSPIGDDAATIYPVVDGYAGEATDQSYTNIRADTGDQSDTSGTSSYAGYLRCAATPNTDVYIDMYRGIFSFNTSSLGASGATIDSALLKTTTLSRSNSIGTPEMAITGGTLASNTSIANGDYAGFSSTPLTDFVSLTSLPSTNGVNYNWTFNSAGKTYIQNRLTGTYHTVLYLRDSWDINSSYGGVWSNLAINYFRYYTNESTTDSYDPYLYVTYTPGGGTAPVSAFSANVTSGYPPLIVGYTDSSTNTPTAWNWTFGDGGTSTSQNPAYTYDNLIGASITQYTVNMTASNAFGSDDELKSNYITLYPLNGSFSANVTSGCAPLNVGFTDLTGNGTPSSWDWNFGGDGTSAAQNPAHTFSTPGTYWISLNASNTYSYGIRNWTGLITVSAGAPTASFSANDTTPCTDQPVLFTDASTSSPSNWSWDFNNDGTPDSFLQNPTNTFSVAGLYTVNLTVSNTCGSDSEVKSNYINSSVCTPTPTPTPTPTATVTTITTIDVNWSYIGNFTGRALGESWPVLLTFFGDMIWLLAWIFFIFLMFLAFLKISGR